MFNGNVYLLVSVEDGSVPKREKEEVLQKKKNEKRPFDKEQKATDDYHYERFKKQFRRYWNFLEKFGTSIRGVSFVASEIIHNALEIFLTESENMMAVMTNYRNK